MTFYLWTLVIPLVLCINAENSLKRYWKNPHTLNQKYKDHYQDRSLYSACEEHRYWTTVQEANTVNNEAVETHPNWRQFEIVSCAHENAPCTGIDSELYQSTCKTQMSPQPAMVRHMGSSVESEYGLKFIMLPNMCTCFVDNYDDYSTTP